MHSQEGDHRISRVKENTSVVVLHTYYQAGETFDRLVWLGAWNIKGKYVVRQDIVSLSKGRVGVGKKRAERDRRASKW